MDSKKRFLRTSVLLGMLISLVLSACTAKTKSASLLVLEWAGYELSEYHPAFEEQHPDVPVDFTFMADDAESFAKAESNPSIDILHPCANYFNLFVEKGLVQPIDTSRLTYWNDVFPELAEIGQVDGKQYFIPWDWGFEAIAYRTDKVQSVPQSWADLWKPEYQGHVSIFDAGENAQLITALAIGFDPYNTTDEQQEQIKQKLIELKPNLLNYWSDYTEIINLLANGDAWVVGNAWNDAYITLKRENSPVEYVMPEEGAIGWMCGYSISSKTQNLDLVYDYLNALMAPEANGKMAEDYAYGPGNRASLEMMDQMVVEQLKLNDPDILNQVIFMRPLTEEQHKRFTDMWTEVKAAP